MTAKELVVLAKEKYNKLIPKMDEKIPSVGKGTQTENTGVIASGKIETYESSVLGKTKTHIESQGEIRNRDEEERIRNSRYSK